MKQISPNFGTIKDAIYVFSAKEIIIENSNKSIILNKFFESIKNNPVLKLQYLIYKNIENGHCSKDYLAERYINQNLKLFENIKWEDIITANRDLKMEILKQNHVQSVPGKLELYEAIHTLIKSVSYNKFTEIDASQTAYDLIMEHLLKPVPNNSENELIKEHTDFPKFLSWRFVTNLAVSNYNERYNHLTESEKKLVKILLSPLENKMNYYLDLKNENLKSIQNIDNLPKETFEKFKNKLNKLNESIHPKEIDEAIINLEELKQNLLELEKTEKK